jgi:hypothetical protein
MSDWLTVRGHMPGALFVAVNKSGRVGSSLQVKNNPQIYVNPRELVLD